jgi:hypothetical protein
VILILYELRLQPFLRTSLFYMNSALGNPVLYELSQGQTLHRQICMLLRRVDFGHRLGPEKVDSKFRTRKVTRKFARKSLPILRVISLETLPSRTVGTKVTLQQNIAHTGHDRFSSALPQTRPIG